MQPLRILSTSLIDILTIWDYLWHGLFDLIKSSLDLSAISLSAFLQFLAMNQFSGIEVFHEFLDGPLHFMWLHHTFMDISSSSNIIELYVARLIFDEMSARHLFARKCKHSIEAFNFSLLSFDEIKTVLIIAALVFVGLCETLTSSVDIHDVEILKSDIGSLDHFVRIPHALSSHAV